MSGPRLQSNLIEGMGNCGGLVYQPDTLLGGFGFYYENAANDTNSIAWSNDYTLQDLQDGRQAFRRLPYENVVAGLNTYFPIRYALKTTTSGKYVLLSIGQYSGKEVATIERCAVGDGVYDYSNAETLVVELPKANWKSFSGNEISSYERTPQIDILPQYNIYTPQSFKSLQDKGESSSAGKAYMTVSSSSSTITYTFEFASDIKMMFVQPSADTIPWLLDMKNKQVGSIGDFLKTRTKSYDFISKVYSPMKGCYCLKNFADGEIPILNE